MRPVDCRSARKAAPFLSGRTRSAALVVAAALSLAVAPAARAGIVAPASVPTIDGHINLVGWSSQALDPANAADSTLYLARFTTTAYDIHHCPIPGLLAWLDFSGCLDVRIAATQSYRGETSVCPQACVQNYTNAEGSVSFVVIGGLANRGGHPERCAKLYFDGYLVGSLAVGAFDQDDSGGMTLADIAWFWNELGSASAHAGSDLSGNGYVTLADVALAWSALGHPFDRSGQPVCP
jgi:hypothetical protein